MKKEIDNFPDKLRKARESKTFLWIMAISFVSDEPGK
jgi:hypothetical protein